MKKDGFKELHRRSLVKALLWRIIGVIWTWIGAYVILMFVPPSKQSAAFIATLIVFYHHSTRMIMYYAYERVWASIGWGRGKGALFHVVTGESAVVSWNLLWFCP